MSDFANQVVLAAVNAAGPVGNNPQAWRAKIRDDYVPMIAAMVREGSPLVERADQVMESRVFAGELLGMELEESSQRMIVRFKSETTSKSDDEGDGTETIRTYRVDSAQGKTQHRRLQEAGVGAKLLIYKFMEPSTSEKGREYRVLAHFEVLSTGSQASSSPTERPAQAPPATPPPAGGADNLMARLNALPGPVMAKVVREFRKKCGEFPPTDPKHRAALEHMINEEES